MTSNPNELILEADKLSTSNPKKAIELYDQLINSENNDPELLKNKESAIIKSGEMLQKLGDAEALSTYVRGLEPVWNVLPRAKTAKLIRSLLDLFDGMVAIDGAVDDEQRSKIKFIEMKLCVELVDWCVRDKRAFLKQSLEVRLANLYLDNKLYTEALSLVGRLLRELKKMEDKLTLVEVHLLECKIYFVLRNGPKAKAALTASRSNANSIYCPPLLQAAIDMQSALLHADDGDFKTAYSYFIEALDSYSSQNDPKGALALKYMLLCKIMMGQSDEIDTIANGKLGQRYSLGDEVTAMKSVGEAYKNKSLQQFEGALSKYPKQLGTDMMIHAHFQSLYDQLLQQNLLLLIEPYSKVQLSHIAKMIGLPIDVIESKLSTMILDKKLNGIIDQNERCLIIVEETLYDKSFELSLETVKHLESAVDALYQKATRIA